MNFCTKCGQKNLGESRFCDECGNSLVKPDPIQSERQGSSEPVSPNATVLPTPMPAALMPGKKFGLYIGFGFGALVILFSGLYFVLADESPSNEVFAKAIDRSLSTSPSPGFKSRYCLNNISYDKDSLTVNGNNQNTQRWMSVLTKAGLYSEPELVSEPVGIFQSTQLIYKKSEAGKKAIQGRQLCIADGLKVVRVESFTPPEKVGQIELSRAIVKLALKNPMPWVSTEETRAAAPSLGEEFDSGFLLHVKDGKWEVADEILLRNAALNQREAGRNNAKTQAHSSTGGFIETLKKMFSPTASNPLIGRWKSDVMGVTIANFEFDGDTMVSNGQKARVRYEVEDRRVTVYSGDGSNGSVFNIIDKDTVSLNAGLMKMKLIRVE